MAARTGVRRQGAWLYCTIDLTNIHTDDEAFAAIEEAKTVIAQHPPRSLRVLTDVTNSRMSIPVIGALREFVEHNEPFVDRSAITGLRIVHRVALRQIVRITGREIKEFPSRDDAMRWLAAE